MTSIEDCKNIARTIFGMGGHGKSLASITITLVRMVREPHEHANGYMNGDAMVSVTENQVTDYAAQLFYWLTSVRESRPTWTVFPRERWADIEADPRLTSECYRLALWAHNNEDPAIGGGVSE